MTTALMVSPDRLMALWAKDRSCGPERYHPLPCHLLDVAAVAGVVWDAVLTCEERRWIAASMKLTVDEARRWVSFLAGAHDCGKAAAVFQLQLETHKDRLRTAGFPTVSPGGGAAHGVITTRALRPYLKQLGASGSLAETLAVAVGGHHGVLPSKAVIQDVGPSQEGTGIWTDARLSLLELLAHETALPTDRLPHVTEPVAVWLAGFVSVVDWIGSDADYFPCAGPDRSRAASYDPHYVMTARRHARDALRGLGWFAQPPAGAPASFVETFGWEPNAAQRAVLALEYRLDEPGLVIVETPTGSGKTEAALWLAQRWAQRLGQRGFYVALPTQATSDQMFDRVAEYLGRRFPASVVNVQLLHGHAALSSAFEALRREGYTVFAPTEVSEDGPGGAVAAAEWFTHRKRGLLAPFGVGTVDQALLAVLQTHHVFVRLFGLAHRTVIIDEVHAYDAYMSTLLEQLLTWLAALGSSVVLLSATLPDARRRRLAEAYLCGTGGAPAMQIGEARYPRLTVVSPTHGATSRPIPGGPADEIVIEWIEPLVSPGPGAPWEGRLRDALVDGGTAAVICNTVARAQQVYLRLRGQFPGVADDGGPEVALLHARFPWDERAQREHDALVRYGKPEVKVGGHTLVRRPRRAILVATQVIEQSLDIDFDLMVTDLAPGDLLLQRAGRLHRHSDHVRPPRLKKRCLWIGSPEGGPDGPPTFDPGSEKVYFPHILLRTWLALRAQKAIRVPADVEALIEAVYGEVSVPSLAPVLQKVWDTSYREMAEARHGESAQAEARYIRSPSDIDHLWELVRDPRQEDAPELHPALQALTRLSGPNVTVIFLDGTEAEPGLGEELIDLHRKPSTAQAGQLLRRSVSLSDARVVFSLLKREVPGGWQESPLLRTCRPLVLSESGTCAVGRWTLRLDPDLGVVIE